MVSSLPIVLFVLWVIGVWLVIIGSGWAVVPALLIIAFVVGSPRG